MPNYLSYALGLGRNPTFTFGLMSAPGPEEGRGRGRAPTSCGTLTLIELAADKRQSGLSVALSPIIRVLTTHEETPQLDGLFACEDASLGSKRTLKSVRERHRRRRIVAGLGTGRVAVTTTGGRLSTRMTY